MQDASRQPPTVAALFAERDERRRREQEAEEPAIGDQEPEWLATLPAGARQVYDIGNPI